jgi:hypothetical protein
MIHWMQTFFLHNWPRKLSALIISLLIWLTMNQSITMTRRFLNIPIRITNLKEGRTIQGLSSVGMLEDQRMELVITGKKYVLKNISASDLEVVIDANQQTGLWQPAIRASNIYNASTKMPLTKAVSKVSSSPMTLHIVPLIKKTIPIYISPPKGESPIGYSFMNIWPLRYEVTITGSKREVDFLEERGVPLQFNLSQISKEKLDRSTSSDLIRFEVPDTWKKIRLPFPPYNNIAITDKNASHIYINFLKNDLIPIADHLPITFFTPEAPSIEGPISIASNSFIQKSGSNYYFNAPLYVEGVSPHFANLIKNYLQIVIYLDQFHPGSRLRWSLNIVAKKHLMKQYVRLIAERDKLKITPTIQEQIELDFQTFASKMRLYMGPKKPLILNPSLEGKTIFIETPTHRPLTHD